MTGLQGDYTELYRSLLHFNTSFLLGGGGTNASLVQSTDAAGKLYQNTIEALKSTGGNPLEVRQFLASLSNTNQIPAQTYDSLRTIFNTLSPRYGDFLFEAKYIGENVSERSQELAKYLLGKGGTSAGGAALVGTYWQAICAFCSLDIGAIALGGAEAMAVGGAFVLAAALAGAALGYGANSLMESASLMLTDKPLVDHYFSDDNAAWAHQNLAWAGF